MDAVTLFDTSSHWAEYYRANASAIPESLWRDTARLTAREQFDVACSLREFQLGEGSEGRTLLMLAEEFAEAENDPEFVRALALFVREEQRHSWILGQFLDRERIPRMRQHWSDDVFRCLRKLAGLETACTVLVSAELISVAFYRALAHATSSPLLQAISREILRDEAGHLEFQAWILSRIRKRHSMPAVLLAMLLQRILLAGTMLVVWRQHRRVFRAAGYGPDRFWRETSAQFVGFEERIAARSECGGLVPAFRSGAGAAAS